MSINFIIIFSVCLSVIALLIRGRWCPSLEFARHVFRLVMKEKCYTMYEVECEQKPFVGKVNKYIHNKIKNEIYIHKEIKEPIIILVRTSYGD